MDQISVIIVNWNGKKFLSECLEGLRRQVYRSFSSTLVDNGSTDGSVDFVLQMKRANIDAYTGVVIVYPGSTMWDMFLEGMVDLQKISNQRIRRNSPGLFSSKFEDVPYFVPNNFLPKHKYFTQEKLEKFIAKSLNKIRDN